MFPTPVPTAKDDAEGGWLKDHYYMVAAGTPVSPLSSPASPGLAMPS